MPLPKNLTGSGGSNNPLHSLHVTLQLQIQQIVCQLFILGIVGPQAWRIAKAGRSHQRQGTGHVALTKLIKGLADFSVSGGVSNSPLGCGGFLQSC